MSEELMNTATTAEETTMTAESTETAVDTGNATTEEQMTPQTATQGTAQETPQERQERLFRQEEVNRIVQERLAREKQRFEQELKSNPYLSYLEQIAQENGMSIDQLIENDRKFREQQKINELIQKNIPPDIAKEVYESRKFREQYQIEQQKRQQEQLKQQMYQEFLQMYPDVKPEQIPAEVWQMVKQGYRLAAAYAIHENKQLKSEMAKFQQQQQVQQANAKNAESSTGSAKSQGATGGYISREQFDANKHDINWVRKNLKLIEESKKHWK